MVRGCARHVMFSFSPQSTLQILMHWQGQAAQLMMTYRRARVYKTEVLNMLRSARKLHVPEKMTNETSM